VAVRSSSVLRLGYFGRPGSFSHLAALRRFPKAELVECPTVEEAFAQLLAGAFGDILVPVENASSGTITNTADQLMRLAKSEAAETLRIREALAMRIELALMARSEAGEIARIYSHRAPFDHARDWLQAHYPKAEQVIVESTSEAAKRAAEEGGVAAIAGVQAAAEHGLKILTRRVGDQVANQTTFIIVGAPLLRPARPTHTSLVFELPHVAGSLVAVLQVLSRRKLNLTKILSRPIPGRFEEYRFMIEFFGASPEPAVVEALGRLKKITTFLAEIGRYAVRKI
jgi:chorismate mutase / prephenate dehydratase